MSTSTSFDPDDEAHLTDCVTDPGALTNNDAIRAMTIHHSCPPHEQRRSPRAQGSATADSGRLTDTVRQS
ncbi:hypothetical protein [Nocardia pseudovaccinii]|uniref:hypothetical protein n=1 Tax=Nocardia pseudovaccinii TaxID=189540 RepID=UPI0007A4B40B|nr:hypothetical protein [Nocardia pseudovaccinii]